MPSWSPDGGTLYFNSNRDGGLAVWSRHLSDGILHRITPTEAFAAAAFGKELIYGSRTGSLSQSDLDGMHPHALPAEFKPEPVMSWYVNDGYLYMTHIDANGQREIVRRAANGTIESLGQVRGLLVANAPDIAVSPDNKWLLLAKQDFAESDLRLRTISDLAR